MDFLDEVFLSIPRPPGRALCAEADPEEWFPEKGGSTRAAKRICGRCEIRVACLQLALDNREQHGIWGGLTPRQRKKLLKRRDETAPEAAPKAA